MIYLDNNATTPLDPRVLEAMLPFLREHYANPSSPYAAGRAVRRAIDQAREQVAALLDCDPVEITFTGSGTEGDNAALASAAALAPQAAHLVTIATEHSAVLEPAHRWAATGQRVTYLGVDRLGFPDLEKLRALLAAQPATLVSAMWANNETGLISPVAEIAALAHAHGALFHTDAVQIVGKHPISLRQAQIDYLSLSGHKFHAPKGIGALYVSKRVRFQPWMLGGGQESGRRSGTENVAGIVGLGQAAALMRQDLAEGGPARIATLRDAFEAQILTTLPETQINGDPTRRLPHTSSLTFPGIESAGLLILLDEKGLACSAGSACHTGTLHPSHVLEAMGFDAEHARQTLRFSWSRLNTLEETQRAAQLVIQCVQKMQRLHSGAGPVVMHT